ncbi:hypothetical protein CKO27_20925 [Thiocystis violacea]|nr:hypothetical protein [Thiocystis violacea]
MTPQRTCQQGSCRCREIAPFRLGNASQLHGLVLGQFQDHPARVVASATQRSGHAGVNQPMDLFEGVDRGIKPAGFWMQAQVAADIRECLQGRPQHAARKFQRDMNRSSGANIEHMGGRAGNGDSVKSGA